MKLHRYSQWKLGVALATGAFVASVLCVQCVRTYLYTDAVLIPQQAEREAERQVGILNTATRGAGINDPHALGPALDRVLESASDRVLWMRVLNPEGNLLAQAGNPQRPAKIPPDWGERVETHESLGSIIDTGQGKVFLALLPFRLARPPHPPETKPEQSRSGAPSGGHRAPYFVELAIPLTAVAGAFDGLRQNLVVGLIASIALMVALAIIALRGRHYVRGKYLESELHLARRVQPDLQPKAYGLSLPVDFAASVATADHVGGDFYDIFEADSGKIAIVLGDVSGKGIPAALLVSVVQGAIRSSTASEHEYACERINCMLCERTACERFATLFWGVFDPVTRTLRYVNAGHPAPFLIRQVKAQVADEPAIPAGTKTQIIRLDEGGPMLGVLPDVRYSAGAIEFAGSDTLILYSDGLNETTNRNGEEFGVDRMEEFVSGMAITAPVELCERLTNEVTAFSHAAAPADDRTLLVVRFPPERAAPPTQTHGEIEIPAVA